MAGRQSLERVQNEVVNAPPFAPAHRQPAPPQHRLDLQAVRLDEAPVAGARGAIVQRHLDRPDDPAGLGKVSLGHADAQLAADPCAPAVGPRPAAPTSDTRSGHQLASAKTVTSIASPLAPPATVDRAGMVLPGPGGPTRSGSHLNAPRAARALRRNHDAGGFASIDAAT